MPALAFNPIGPTSSPSCQFVIGTDGSFQEVCGNQQNTLVNWFASSTIIGGVANVWVVGGVLLAWMYFSRGRR